MGNYDHTAQRNIDKKLSQYGMIAEKPEVAEHKELSTVSPPQYCTSTQSSTCVRAMEYLRRIVKSLLRQMNVHSHNFGPGEAITIDLQAELKFDDYIVLTKFMNSNDEFDKYLYRIDEIMFNFIHVVDHSSSRFDFLDRLVNFPAFYNFKFWIILVTSMVILSLIVLLFVKAFNTRQVHDHLLYAFLIIFILSCVWSFSSMYEEKKADVMARMTQVNDLPPKDCDPQNWSFGYTTWYWFKVDFFRYKDQCQEYYRTTMTDPFWKVNPMEAIASSIACIFKPLGYIGERLGEFYMGFINPAPWLLKGVMLLVLVFLTVLIIIGPFRISTPLMTIEPVWRPVLPALERHPVQPVHAIERVRNEIMERPDGPVIKCVRDATTDMDGFLEYLTDEGNDELEIVGPFARFNINREDDIQNRSSENTDKGSVTCASVIPKPAPRENEVICRSSQSSSSDCTFSATTSVNNSDLKSVLGNDIEEQNLKYDEFDEVLLKDALKEDEPVQGSLLP